jgi:hypothetical protein
LQTAPSYLINFEEQFLATPTQFVQIRNQVYRHRSTLMSQPPNIRFATGLPKSLSSSQQESAKFFEMVILIFPYSSNRIDFCFNFIR